MSLGLASRIKYQIWLLTFLVLNIFFSWDPTLQPAGSSSTVFVVIFFLASYPSFKPRRTGYESVCYGINNTRPAKWKVHFEVAKNLKFGVDRANIEQDIAI